MPTIINEQAIVNSLRQVPTERWSEVLRFLEALQTPEPAILTGADLIQSGLIGLWGDRDDLGTEREFADQLRRRSESRYGDADAAGY